MRYALTSIPATKRINTSLVMTDTSQESDRQGQKGETKRYRHQLRNAEQTQLGVRALCERDGDRQYEDFVGPGKKRHEDRARSRTRRDAHRYEQIHEQRQIQQFLQRRRPLDEGEVRSCVLEDHRLVDHRQLELRRRMVDRKASRFGDDDDEKSGEREEIARMERRPALQNAPDQCAKIQG